MSRPRRSVVGATAGLVILLSGAVWLAWAQQPPPQPFGPDWAMLIGGKVFADKGCKTCHAIRGFGATAGPDLSRIEKRSFFDLGAALSNHLRGVALQRPSLTPGDVSNLIAWVFTLQYYDERGDPKAGEAVFAQKACVQCHEVGGQGGRIGPGLDFLKRTWSPVLVAAAMWNHGPEMAEVLQAQGIARPTLTGKELVDLVAYIVEAARDGGGGTAQVLPGVPERGGKLFAEKGCVICHAVGGKGGQVGPELGKRHHVSLSQFGMLMWNHGPVMWPKMKERGLQVPRLRGQEMADIVAYLYASHYFDPAVDPGRGRELLEIKGCLTCHAVRGKGGKIGADLASYAGARTAAGLVAAMWNHPRYLEAQRREVSWPVLTGPDLADMGAHLTALPPLPKAGPKPKGS